MRRLLLAVLLAVPLYAHEGLHEQIAAVTRQIASSPRNAGLYLQRGELYRLHGEWALAATDYDRAERLDAKLDTVLLARGTLLLDSGRASAAIAPLQRYARAHADDPRGSIALGRALVKSGRALEGAAELAKATARATPPDPDLVLEQANALVLAKRPQEAVRILDAMMARFGSLVTLQLAAIDIETSAGNYDAALQRIDNAVDASVRKETWLARRGDVLAKAGRPAEARLAYKAALAALDTLPPARRRSRAVTELEQRLEQELAH
jgi:predicted Zn-dependent protease